MVFIIWLLPMQRYLVAVLEWTRGLGVWGIVIVALTHSCLGALSSGLGSNSGSRLPFWCDYRLQNRVGWQHIGSSSRILGRQNGRPAFSGKESG